MNVNRRLNALAKEKKELEKQLNEMLEQERKPLVTADLYAEAEGTYPFSLKYYDNGASWHPVYEIHTEGKGSELEFRVRAALVQNTARLIHTFGSRKQYKTAFFRQTHHFGSGLFRAYKHNAHHIHHFRGTSDLRIDEAGEQHRLILHVRQHIAHHITAASGVYVATQMLLAHQHVSVEQFPNGANLHTVQSFFTDSFSEKTHSSSAGFKRRT
jgi:hypothetical protein